VARRHRRRRRRRLRRYGPRTPGRIRRPPCRSRSCNKQHKSWNESLERLWTNPGRRDDPWQHPRGGHPYALGPRRAVTLQGGHVTGRSRYRAVTSPDHHGVGRSRYGRIPPQHEHGTKSGHGAAQSLSTLITSWSRKSRRSVITVCDSHGAGVGKPCC
jgi:hypothetical protein